MILEPEYFNSAIMKKMDILVQDGVGPVLERMLRDRLGPDWLSILNTHLNLDRYAIKMKRNRPDWDFNQILHAVQLYGQRSNTADAKEEKQLAETLKRLRNGISHAGYDNIRNNASKERTLEFMRAGQDLLERFGALAQAREVATTIRAYEEYMKGDNAQKLAKPNNGQQAPPVPTIQQKGNPGQGQGSGAPTATAPQAPQSPSSPKDDPKAQTASSTEKGKPENREPIKLPKSGAGILWFPAVGDGKNDDFGYFYVTRSDNPQPNVLAILPGLPDAKKPVVQQIVNDTRANEEHDLLCSWTTRFRSAGTFVGSSFGLAASFADRSARYGLRGELEDVTIIATGTIIPDRGGSVGPISDLYKKMVLIETSPHSRELRSILFLFPAANLDQPDEQTREKLSQWNGIGSRVKWRAVRHIDELNDLLGVGDTRPPKEPAVAVVIDETKLESPVGEQPPFSEISTHSETSNPHGPSVTKAPPQARRNMVLLPAAGALVGFAVLGTWVGILMFERPRIDPVQLQQSDLRIRAVANVAASSQNDPTNEAFCDALGKASSALTELDRGRLTPEASNALGQWNECHNKFSASNGRISQVEQLAFDLNAGDDTKTLALSQAMQALTSFDIARPLSDSAKRAIATGNVAVAQVVAIHNRMSSLQAALEEARSGSASEEIRLRATLQGLADVDLQTASVEEKRLIEDARTLLEQRDRRAARVSNFQLAASHFSPDDDYTSTKAYLDAFDALTAEDKAQLSSSGNSKTSGINLARQKVADSLARVSAVTTAWHAFSDGESHGSLRYRDIQQLQNAVAALTEFDEPAMSSDTREAIAKTKDVPNIIAESKKRISAATDLALAAKIKNYRINTYQYDAIQSGIEALEPLDVDRLVESDRTMLVDACKATPNLAPGMVAPAYNLSCNKL